MYEVIRQYYLLKRRFFIEIVMLLIRLFEQCEQNKGKFHFCLATSYNVNISLVKKCMLHFMNVMDEPVINFF